MGWCFCIHVHDGLKEVLKFRVEGSMQRERSPSPRGAQAPKWPRCEAWSKDKGAYPRPELPVPWTGSSSTGIHDFLAVAADLIEAEKADEAVKDQQQDQQREEQQDQQQDQQRDKVYWDEGGVWQLWGGCWWKETSRGWWEKWRDTAGQQ